MRLDVTSALLTGSMCLILGALCGCSSGHRNRQQPNYPAAGAPVTSTTTTSTAPAGFASPASAAPVATPPIALTNSEPTTPSAYVATPASKPKIAGLSEEELKRCEAELPALESCKPSSSPAETPTAATDEVRICVVRYVAAVQACLCKAGSKAYCQFADDQKRELTKMAH